MPDDNERQISKVVRTVQESRDQADRRPVTDDAPSASPPIGPVVVPAVPDRTAVLAAGREAARSRRQADSGICRDRVTRVIDEMKRTGEPLSDTAITRRAQVHNQYLQRHEDLKAFAASIRADVADRNLEAALARRSEGEVAMAVENRMLTEQNRQLSADLKVVLAELKMLRAEGLGSRANLTIAGRPDDLETVNDRLREERDAALRDSQEAHTKLVSVHTVNQKLMIENTRLLGG
jgi:hypothetical protein